MFLSDVAHTTLTVKKANQAVVKCSCVPGCLMSLVDMFYRNKGKLKIQLGKLLLKDIYRRVICH